MSNNYTVKSQLIVYYNNATDKSQFIVHPGGVRNLDFRYGSGVYDKSAPHGTSDKRQVDYIYGQALAMEQAALTDLIKQEQSSTIYNYIHNPISTGSCLITDMSIQLPIGASKYTARIPVPRFGDAVQSFKIRLLPGNRIAMARAQINQEFNKHRSTSFETCHINKLPTTENEYTVIAYSELVVIACDSVLLELTCEVDNEVLGSSHAQDVNIQIARIQVWADYIFYSTNERSKKLFANPATLTR